MYFDVNGDGVLNVTDIVTVVNHILDPQIIVCHLKDLKD